MAFQGRPKQISATADISVAPDTPTMLNLPPAPSWFRGLDLDKPLQVYSRHLPHWRQNGASYFVTFRLTDSISRPQLLALKRWRSLWEKNNPEPRNEQQWMMLAREIYSRTEAYLDEGFGACFFRDPIAAQIMAESLVKFQRERCFTSCFIVMPNHVHAVIHPFHEHPLEEMLEGCKGYTARQINTRLARRGKLWEQESYDRIIRDEEHLFRVIQYIGNNGRKAGLREHEFLRWVDPELEEAGWGFREACV